MIGFIIAGLVIGALARLIKPGRQNLGIVATLLLGLAGSVIGGAVASLLGTGDIFELNVLGFIVAVIAAVVLIGVAESMTGRGAGGSPAALNLFRRPHGFSGRSLAEDFAPASKASASLASPHNAPTAISRPQCSHAFMASRSPECSRNGLEPEERETPDVRCRRRLVCGIPVSTHFDE